LTTVTDHRRTPLGKARAVRTAGNGSDQITIAGSLPTGRYSLARPVMPRSPKRCSTTPGQNGKDLVSTARTLTRLRWKTQCRGSRILRGLTPRGDTRPRGLQNLLLNLYSLVKERLISQAPPNAGESAVRRTCRRTRSSSARCFDHHASGDLGCRQGTGTSREG
jgi:hypothetical protein